jgi:hypothetical protein
MFKMVAYKLDWNRLEHREVSKFKPTAPLAVQIAV